MRSKPFLASWRITSSRIGRSATGTSGFGSTVVYGRSLVPLPPARITALIAPPRVSPAGALPAGEVAGQLVVPVGQRALLDVGEHPRCDRVDQAVDGPRNRVPGLEAEPLTDLVERDAVVAGVRAALRPPDPPRLASLLECLD